MAANKRFATQAPWIAQASLLWMAGEAKDAICDKLAVGGYTVTPHTIDYARKRWPDLFPNRPRPAPRARGQVAGLRAIRK